MFVDESIHTGESGIENPELSWSWRNRSGCRSLDRTGQFMYCTVPCCLRHVHIIYYIRMLLFPRFWQVLQNEPKPSVWNLTVCAFFFLCVLAFRSFLFLCRLSMSEKHLRIGEASTYLRSFSVSEKHLLIGDRSIYVSEKHLRIGEPSTFWRSIYESEKHLHIEEASPNQL